MSDQFLAYLTDDLPGIGGVLKARPEDFLVEEQPLYDPVGKGEHLYVFVEKRGMTTSEAIRQVARACRVSKRDVGYAGMKDKHAVTRQHLSVYMPDASDDRNCVERMGSDKLQVLWADRHENKLRRGHHGGNRFVIYVRDVEPTGVLHAKRVLDRIEEVGAPNYVGEQRFGYRGENHLLGALLLKGEWEAFLDLQLGQPRETDHARTREGREAYERGDYEAALDVWPRSLRHDRQSLDALRQGRSPREAVLAIEHHQRDFLISSVQSEAFNIVLDSRLRAGRFASLMAGDLAWKHDSRAVFAVDQATADLENAPAGRVAAKEVSPSGPMWGTEMTRPDGEVLAEERAALEATGLSEDDLAGGDQGSADGVRRPMRQFLQDPDVSGGVDENGPYIRLAFELGRGSFATVALREVMKDD